MRLALVGLCVWCACGRLDFGVSSDASSSDARVLPPVCSRSDPRLLACYPFDGDLIDGSVHINDGVMRSGSPVVSYGSGVDGSALLTDPTSQIDVPGADLVASRYTIDVWIRPDSVSTNQIILDNDSHWAAILEPGGMIRCAVFNGGIETATLAIAGEWIHVACVHDGNVLTAHVGGVAESSAAVGAPAAGTGSVAIAGNGPSDQLPRFAFQGALDRLRIWNDALLPEEICAAAGGC